MKRIVIKLSGMPSGLPARPATTRSLSVTSCELPGSGSGFITDGETGTVIALDRLVHGAMQAHHQGHLRR
jgi:hypothetical protein